MKRIFYQSAAFALSAVLTWSVCDTNVFAAEQQGETDFSYIYMEDQQVEVSKNQNILIQLQKTDEKLTSATLQYHTQGDTKTKTADAVQISDHTLLFTLPSGTKQDVVVLEEVEWYTNQGAHAIHLAEEKITYQISQKNEIDDGMIYFSDGKGIPTSPIKVTVQDDMKETIASIEKAMEDIQNRTENPEQQQTTQDKPNNQRPQNENAVKPQSAEDKAAHTGGELFRDVKQGNWYYGAVSFVMNKGLMSGLADGNFGVGKTINRAQLLSILYRMAGSPAVNATAVYTDVPADAFYAKAAVWAGQEGLLFAQNTNTLKPMEEVTKEELIFTLFRYAQQRGFADVTQTANALPFTDADAISPSAKEAITWAVSTGLIHGNENHLLQPQAKTSRAVCASMISRFCDLYLPNTYPNIPIYAKVEQIELTANDKKAGTFTISVSGMQASTDVSMIEAAVWSAADGSDIHTYVGQKQNNRFVVQGNIQNHKFHTGTYHVNVYAVLSNGIRVHAGTQDMTVEGDEAQMRIQKHVNQVYEKTGKDLYACYQWVVQNMRYKKMPIPTQPPAGYTKEQWNAVVAFEQHQGNCFNFAAAFCELAKGLGYDARYVEGAVPLARGGRGPHGWVEITKNGAVYICDPDLQYEIKGRNFYMQPVGRTVIRYYR